MLKHAENETFCLDHADLLREITGKKRQTSNPKNIRVHRSVRNNSKTATTLIHLYYELFNCSNLKIRYKSWNYRGCWHQTCPLMAFGELFTPASWKLGEENSPPISIDCHYLEMFSLGNLRACCLPWMW